MELLTFFRLLAATSGLLVLKFLSQVISQMILIFYSAKGDLGFAKVAKQASTSRIAAGALVVHLQIGAKIARLAQKNRKVSESKNLAFGEKWCDNFNAS